MWLIWFKWVNAGELIRKEAASLGQWKFIYGAEWKSYHKQALVLSIVILIWAITSVLYDEGAMLRKKLSICEAYSTFSRMWRSEETSQEIQTGWSRATIGLLGILFSVVTIEKPDQNVLKNKNSRQNLADE